MTAPGDSSSETMRLRMARYARSAARSTTDILLISRYLVPAFRCRKEIGGGDEDSLLPRDRAGGNAPADLGDRRRGGPRAGRGRFLRQIQSEGFAVGARPPCRARRRE